MTTTNIAAITAPLRAASSSEPPITELRDELKLDLEHPFFFDHALDHVSGMHLLCGFFDLLGGAGCGLNDRRGDRARLSVDFTAFAELTVPVRVCADRLRPHANDLWAVSAQQNGQLVCKGRVDLLHRAEALSITAPRVASQVRQQAGAPASLVHRHRPENVMLGARLTEADHPDGWVFPVMVPSPDHYLAQVAPSVHGVATLVEAGRQLTTLLGLTVTGMPVHSHLIWLRVAVDLPIAVPSSFPLWLRWRPDTGAGPKRTFVMDLVGPDGPDRIGRIVSSCAVVDGPVFAMLRGAKQ